MKINILEQTQQGYAFEIHKLLGKGKQHAALVYAAWMREGELTKCKQFVEPHALPLVEQIIALTEFSLPTLSLRKDVGNVSKFLLKYADGLESESVLIPMEAGNTLCLSSQVGCKMGCAFCETGRMGLLRSLSTEEIIAQVYTAKFLLGAEVRNIVFMGMGEPLDNFEAVMQAVKVLTDPSGLAFGPSRISISTSGIVEGIYKMIEVADPAINLAVSVNAPNDQIRKRIMPVNKQWDMQALKDAMIAYCQHPRREIFAEYVLMKDLNDSWECADQLAEYLQGLKVKINLIPYNPQSRDRFAPPSLETIDIFAQKLRSHGYQVFVRLPKGQDIMAACGQLGNVKLRQSLRSVPNLNQL
jgi:23S rRNA (adenine2503-C2)-methyltransferase